jgi:repressor LexA
MKEQNITAAELSRRTGISKARISQYIHGAYSPSGKALVDIASTLLCSEEYLLGSSDSHSLTHGKRLKILGEVKCGAPTLAEEIYEGEIISDPYIDADFCLLAHGDSMIGARIYDGDMVFIRAQEAVDNGEIAAVIINDEATLKRVYFYPDEGKLVLSPENPRYAPLVYLKDELNSIKIIGKAVAFQSTVI